MTNFNSPLSHTPEGPQEVKINSSIKLAPDVKELRHITNEHIKDAISQLAYYTNLYTNNPHNLNFLVNEYNIQKYIERPESLQLLNMVAMLSVEGNERDNIIKIHLLLMSLLSEEVTLNEAHEAFEFTEDQYFYALIGFKGYEEHPFYKDLLEFIPHMNIENPIYKKTLINHFSIHARHLLQDLLYGLGFTDIHLGIKQFIKDLLNSPGPVVQSMDDYILYNLIDPQKTAKSQKTCSLLSSPIYELGGVIERIKKLESLYPNEIPAGSHQFYENNRNFFIGESFFRHRVLLNSGFELYCDQNNLDIENILEKKQLSIYYALSILGLPPYFAQKKSLRSSDRFLLLCAASCISYVNLVSPNVHQYISIDQSLFNKKGGEVLGKMYILLATYMLLATCIEPFDPTDENISDFMNFPISFGHTDGFRKHISLSKVFAEIFKNQLTSDSILETISILQKLVEMQILDNTDPDIPNLDYYKKHFGKYAHLGYFMFARLVLEFYQADSDFEETESTEILLCRDAFSYLSENTLHAEKYGDIKLEEDTFYKSTQLIGFTPEQKNSWKHSHQFGLLQQVAKPDFPQEGLYLVLPTDDPIVLMRSGHIIGEKSCFDILGGNRFHSVLPTLFDVNTQILLHYFIKEKDFSDKKTYASLCSLLASGNKGSISETSFGTDSLTYTFETGESFTLPLGTPLRRRYLRAGLSKNSKAGLGWERDYTQKQHSFTHYADSFDHQWVTHFHKSTGIEITEQVFIQESNCPISQWSDYLRQQKKHPLNSKGFWMPGAGESFFKKTSV